MTGIITPVMNANANGYCTIVPAASPIVIMIPGGYQVAEHEAFEVVLLDDFRAGCLNIIIHGFKKTFVS